MALMYFSLEFKPNAGLFVNNQGSKVARHETGRDNSLSGLMRSGLRLLKPLQEGVVQVQNTNICTIFIAII